MKNENTQKEGKTQDKNARKGLSILDIVPLVIFACAIVLLIWAIMGTFTPKRADEALEVNVKISEHKIPALEYNGEDKSGQEFIIIGGEDFQGPVIVNFFASWCTPCKVEHPVLEALQNKVSVPLIGISFNDNPQDTLEFLNDLGNPYTQTGLDKNLSVASDFGVAGIPATFILADSGQIIWRFQGPLSTGHIAEIEKVVEDK